jgi:hypothetical protein
MRQIEWKLVGVEWGLGCIVTATLLPVGLAALSTAAIGNRPVVTSTQQGELYLAAANCVVVAVLVLIAAESGRQQSLVSTAALLVLAVPGYAVWAMLSARALAGERYDKDFASKGGAAWAVVSAIFSFVICVHARSQGPSSED